MKEGGTPVTHALAPGSKGLDLVADSEAAGLGRVPDTPASYPSLPCIPCMVLSTCLLIMRLPPPSPGYTRFTQARRNRDPELHVWN